MANSQSHDLGTVHRDTSRNSTGRADEPFRSVERALFPYAVVLQTVPILAITPLLTQLFGEELGVRLVVTVLIAIFPVITNTLFGLQSTDQMHHDLFTLNHVSRRTRLWRLELPSALPSLMTGIRIASGSAVIGSVVADFFC